MRLITTACLLLTALNLSGAQEETNPAALKVETVLKTLPGPAKPTEIDSFFMKEMKEASLPGISAAIVKKGRILWSGAYGWADIEKKIPVTDDTLFQLASVSKTITACAVMQVVERGGLALDTDINEVLPFKVRNPGHPKIPITLRHLLTHTSGIRDNWDILEGTWVHNSDFPKSLADSMAAYLKPKGDYFDARKNFYKWAPGKKSDYSNVGVALAAYLAELKGGMSFEQLCEKRIFEPLGLNGCGFRLSDVDRSKVAMPYPLRRRSDHYQPKGHHGYLDFPSGTLRTSARQLARFLLSFVGNGRVDNVRLLKEETVKSMRRISFPKIAPEQGLVWFHGNSGGTKVMGHDGGDPGVSTFMHYRLKDGVGFIVLMNGDPRKRRFERTLTQRLLEYADRH